MDFTPNTGMLNALAVDSAALVWREASLHKMPLQMLDWLRKEDAARLLADKQEGTPLSGSAVSHIAAANGPLYTPELR